MRTLVVVLAVLIPADVLLLSVIAFGTAGGEHSFGTASAGDCWRPGTPLQCLNQYSTNQVYYLRTNAFWGNPSQIRARAEPALAPAKDVWQKAPGPQAFQTGFIQPYANVNIYEFPAYQPNDPTTVNRFNQVQAFATTLNWTWNGSAYEYCYLPPESACRVYFSHIYVNDHWDSACAQVQPGGVQNSTFRYVYAHELGHVLGLDDHFGGGHFLMNAAWPTSFCLPDTAARSPTNTELGVLPPCSQIPRGVRCIYNWATGFQKWVLQTGTPLGQTGGNFAFEAGDHNSDGVPDLYAIKMNNTSTQRTELHVLSGANNYQAPWLLQTATPLHQTDSAGFSFAIADWDRGGKPDFIAVKKLSTGSGMTEVHIWSGESNYQTNILSVATQLHQTGSNFEFAAGDYNRDGVVDLYAIKKWDTGGTTEVHPLNGAASFVSFLDHRATAMGVTGNNWTFDVKDYNRDGFEDVVGIRMSDPGLGRTEYHILSGSTVFGTFLEHISTVLQPTDSVNWAFAMADWTLSADGAPDGKVIRKQGTNSTEVHILAGR